MRTSRAFMLATGWAVLAVASIHLLDFPGSVPRFKKESGGGVLFDVSPSFQVETTYRRLADYGQAGRESYFFRNLSVDILLPLSLLPFLYLFMGKAVTSAGLVRPLTLVLFSFSFAYVLFDLAENAGVLVLLMNYPQRLDFLAAILPYVTLIKRGASVLALIVPLGILMFGHAVRAFRPRAAV